MTSKLGTFQTKVQDIVSEALQLYPANVETPEFQFTTMVSDIRANCPNDVMTKLITYYFKSPVYRYIVTSRPSQSFHPLGFPFKASYSMHCWDLFGFFGTIYHYFTPKTSDILFERNIRREILSFVKTGKPNTTAWDTASVNRALLTNMTEVVGSYSTAQCNYWTLKAGMWSYAWIN